MECKPTSWELVGKCGLKTALYEWRVNRHERAAFMRPEVIAPEDVTCPLEMTGTGLIGIYRADVVCDRIRRAKPFLGEIRGTDQNR
jgi:hypothetical protein